MVYRKLTSPFLAVLLIAAVTAVGCATITPVSTPSGKPEIIMPNISKKEMMDALVHTMTTAGFRLKSSSEYQLIFGKQVDSTLVAALLGSRYDSTPEYRWAFTLVESRAAGGEPPGVKVMGDLVVVTNPGSAFERITDWNRTKDAHEVQAAFEEIRAVLMNRR